MIGSLTLINCPDNPDIEQVFSVIRKKQRSTKLIYD